VPAYWTYFWLQNFARFWKLYSFLWEIPRRLNFTCRRFGTSCLFHLHRWCKQERITWTRLLGYLNRKIWSHLFFLLTQPLKMGQDKIQAPGNHSKERWQHTEISHPCNLEPESCAPLRLKSLIQANFASCTLVYIYSPYCKYSTNLYFMYCYKQTFCMVQLLGKFTLRFLLAVVTVLRLPLLLTNRNTVNSKRTTQLYTYSKIQLRIEQGTRGITHRPALQGKYRVSLHIDHYHNK
jgi:hypothetical protein